MVLLLMAQGLQIDFDCEESRQRRCNGERTREDKKFYVAWVQSSKDADPAERSILLLQ